jgi:hypothetical protein
VSSINARTISALLIAFTVGLSACSGNAASSGTHEAGGTSAVPTEADHGPWNMVVLGDSSNRPDECDGCDGYINDYAEAIQRQAKTTVNIHNDSAIELSNLPAGDASALLAQVLADASVREDVRSADIIVISVGFNDTPWNRLDDPCNAAPDYPVVHWSKISTACTDRVVAEYKHTLDQILTQIDTLRGCGEMPGSPRCSKRGGKDTVIRVVTVYNSTIGDNVDPGWNFPAAVPPTIRGNDMMVHAQCEVAGFHGGRCADIYHVLNGPNGNKPATAYLDGQGYTHLNELGHKTAAAALIKLGLAPLR